MQQVVEITRQEQNQLKKALRLRGSVTRMMEGANVSRTAIVNMRDLGRAEQNTVRKIREYLSANQAEQSQKNMARTGS